MYPKQQNKRFGQREQRGQNSTSRNAAPRSEGNSRGFKDIANRSSSNDSRSTYSNREGSSNGNRSNSGFSGPRQSSGGSYSSRRAGGSYGGNRSGFQNRSSGGYNQSRSSRGGNQFPSRHKSRFVIDEAEISDFINSEIVKPKSMVPTKEYPVLDIPW